MHFKIRSTWNRNFLLICVVVVCTSHWPSRHDINVRATCVWSDFRNLLDLLLPYLSYMFYFGFCEYCADSTDLIENKISIQQRPLHFCCRVSRRCTVHPIVRDCNTRIHQKSSTKYFPSWFWYRYPSCCVCGRYGRFKLHLNVNPLATMIDRTIDSRAT